MGKYDLAPDSVPGVVFFRRIHITSPIWIRGESLVLFWPISILSAKEAALDRETLRDLRRLRREASNAHSQINAAERQARARIWNRAKKRK